MLFVWQLQISQAIPNQMYSTFFAPKKYPMEFEILANVRKIFFLFCMLLMRKC